MLEILSPRQMQANLRSSARNAWLVSLGAIASVEEESGQLLDKLAERGRKVEEKRRKQVEKTVQSAGEDAEAVLEKLGSKVDETVAASLDHLAIPTRDQIRELSDRVERLTHLVDQLQAETESERKVYHVTSHDEGWKVQAEGAERAVRVTETKAEAVDTARELAKNQEPSRVVIHRLDGTIQTHHSYGETEEETDSEN